jgi:hypothetical protein
VIKSTKFPFGEKETKIGSEINLMSESKWTFTQLVRISRNYAKNLRWRVLILSHEYSRVDPYKCRWWSLKVNLENEIPNSESQILNSEFSESKFSESNHPQGTSHMIFIFSFRILLE